MAITVTKTNTKVYKQPGGWVKVVYDTGQVDGNGNAVTITATMTQAAIEKEAGVLLPKATVNSIVTAALNKAATPVEVELAAL